MGKRWEAGGQKKGCEQVIWADTQGQLTKKLPWRITVLLRLGVVTLSAWQVVFSSMPREGGWLDGSRPLALQASTPQGEGGKQCRVFAKEDYQE